jgi:hypothetical protein
MTNPTPLSPAAQAVLDAYSNASDGEYVEGVWVVYERTMLSAALRAAAEVLREAYANERYPDHPDDFLFDIAAELEGAHG